MTGDLLYALHFARGGLRYIHVPLSPTLTASIRETSSRSTLSLYWDAGGRLTPVARFIVLCCLEEGVPAAVLSRYMCVSHSTVLRLRSKRRNEGDVPDRADLMKMLEDLAFEGSGKDSVRRTAPCCV
ncbi:hypothetical protein AWB76_07168 [Caballeronia temeraria]|uniref:Uncharacterized protein n=1 Tax=Caballeronia temeraria TaxID=1777137 RepID=A0A158DM33_9BURK|nr:hypothetical protein [Caballeronia temeraria]SAK95644.1 hypothetical protein AWB76_07168 [Caballeronia temeraria]